MGERCKSVSSFGSLNHFKSENKVDAKHNLCLFFFFDIVRIFCSMSEIFVAISDKVFEKILLMVQQYAGGGFMLINLTKISRIPF